jgi:branched-chain amino acid transport system ATP-binding protein
MAILELLDVHTYYGDSYILQGISLQVADRSAATLLGRNGMGKTTVLRTIMGFAPPQRGTIRFKDKTINGLKSFRIAQMGIGLVPQGRDIFSSLSVHENLVMAARGGNQEEAWNLDKIYNLFPILRKRAKFKGTLLSGGEQQMLTIARALMTNPSLLLMDEPSEGLAPLVVQQIGATIARLKESRMAILLVEQNLYMALELADYVYILSKGVIEYESTPDELEANDEIKQRCLGVSGH